MTTNKHKSDMLSAGYTTISKCRICGSNKLSKLFSLGELCISDFVEEKEQGIKAPLELVFCDNCTLVQLKHTAPQELLYTGFYWYRSGVTETMKKALREITETIETSYGLSEGDVVLDIGSNDGTLLRTYQTPSIITVGVEPASNLREVGEKDISHFINDFWTYENYSKSINKKAKAITAIGMFYDMDDPGQFVGDVAKALSDDGIFIAQLMCLKNMIDTNDVGNICHEHLEYYSFKSLKYLFEHNGLEIIDVSINGVNGGSYRLFARKKGSKINPPNGALSRIQKVESDEEYLTSKDAFIEFYNRIEKNKSECVNFINEAISEGKKVWIYGASTKGNTILQFYGLDGSFISGASERSPEKWGKYTVGTKIKIYSEEEARQAQPDYFLVLPYAFFDEMYAREEEWRKKGGKFILPLPEFRIVE